VAVVALVCSLALFALFETWVSSAEQIRSQRELLGALKVRLDAGAEGGGAGRIRPGDAIGLLEAPSIGLEQVFVEGDGPLRLKRGPGHDPHTPMPGAAGRSVIDGRLVTYGAPFHRLRDLRNGDVIYVTTSLGRSRFHVIGPDAPRAEAEIVLKTSEGASVRAALDGQPLLGVPSRTSGADREAPALPVLALELVGLVAVVAGTAVAYRRWAPRVAFALSAPVLLAALFVVFGTVDRLLPPTL
jgi:sortase A